MKKTRISFRKTAATLLLLVMPFCSFGKNAVANPGLQLSFHVFDGSVMLRNYSLQIYRNGEMTDSISVRKQNTFFVTLDLNCNYTIRIKRPGFREQLILIGTTVPDKKKNSFFEYSFDISLVPDTQGASTSGDLPNVLIRYNPVKKDFDRSEVCSATAGHQPDRKKSHRLHLRGLRRKHCTA